MTFELGGLVTVTAMVLAFIAVLDGWEFPREAWDDAGHGLLRPWLFVLVLVGPMGMLFTIFYFVRIRPKLVAAQELAGQSPPPRAQADGSGALPREG